MFMKWPLCFNKVKALVWSFEKKVLSAAAALPSKPLLTEELAVHKQACNHGNIGRHITKMTHSK